MQTAGEDAPIPAAVLKCKTARNITTSLRSIVANFCLLSNFLIVRVPVLSSSVEMSAVCFFYRLVARRKQCTLLALSIQRCEYSRMKEAVFFQMSSFHSCLL